MKTLLTIFLLIVTSVAIAQTYVADILGQGYEQQTIHFQDDYEGRVVCTLIRHTCEKPSKKAVLYVHGFNDYFFQSEMGKWYNAQGFDFYAVDLRKYGRSWLQGQKLNNVRDLKEYFADIDTALRIIKKEGHDAVLLSGHSTGGLVVTCYAQEHSESGLYNALFLNSPFYEFNEPWLLRKLGVPMLSGAGRKHPQKIKKGGFTRWYGYSLHRSQHGEWDYDLSWKPFVAPYVNYGWIRAIHRAQKAVRSGKRIAVPVLVLCSEKSVYPKKWSTRLYEGDAILNVRHIRKYANRLNTADKKVISLTGAVHDVMLSPVEVRQKAYDELANWLKNHSFFK